MALGQWKFVAQFGVQLAELFVGPEEVGGVLHALPLDLKDEDVVLLRGVPLLDVKHVDSTDATVCGQPGIN